MTTSVILASEDVPAGHYYTAVTPQHHYSRTLYASTLEELKSEAEKMRSAGGWVGKQAWLDGVRVGIV